MSRKIPRSSGIGNTLVREPSIPESKAPVTASAPSGASEPFSKGATRRHRTRASSAGMSTVAEPCGAAGVTDARSVAQAAAITAARAAAARRIEPPSYPAFRGAASFGGGRGGDAFTVPSQSGHGPVTRA